MARAAAEFKKTQDELDLELLNAIRDENDLAKVKELVNAGADINVARGLPLHAAAASDSRIKILEYLIDAGADINKYKNNVLITASMKGAVNAIDLLLSLGADPTYNKSMALDFARFYDQKAALKLLEDYIRAGPPGGPTSRYGGPEENKNPETFLGIWVFTHRRGRGKEAASALGLGGTYEKATSFNSALDTIKNALPNDEILTLALAMVYEGNFIQVNLPPSEIQRRWARRGFT